METIVETYIRILKKILNRRTLTVLAAISGIFAALSFFSEAFNIYFSQFMRFELSRTSIPITFLLVSLGSFALIYLQSGGKDTLNNQTRDVIDEFEKYKEIARKQFTATEQAIKTIKNKIDNLEPESTLGDADKQKITDQIIENAGIESIKSIFISEVNELKSKLEEDSIFDRLRRSSDDVISRLKREISDQRLRSNINLILGMLITVGGLYLLWSTVSIVDASDLLKTFAKEGEESNYKFLKSLILPIVPRLLLVIFVEIFAYFFLRLYKDGLSEIKYFQNELTNIESKLYSVMFAYLTKSDDSLKEGLLSLSTTERNFILQKDQTTVELEKAKSESALTQNIIKNIPAIFKKANK